MAFSFFNHEVLDFMEDMFEKRGEATQKKKKTYKVFKKYTP